MSRMIDMALLALTLWREDRSGGTAGMTAVANVVVNRAKADGRTLYEEVTRRLQFSAMTAAGDPELTLYPSENDPQWLQAQQIASAASTGTLTDTTGGATSYYALSMKTPPYWAAKMTHTVTIGGQAFFKVAA